MRVRVKDIERSKREAQFSCVKESVFRYVFRELSAITKRDFFFAFPGERQFERAFEEGFAFFIREDSAIHFSCPFLGIVCCENPFTPYGALVKGGACS